MATGWSSSLLTAAVLTIRIGSTTCCATRQLRCRSTAVGSALVLSSPRGRSVTLGGVDLSPLIQAMRSTRRKPIERFRSFFSSLLEVGLVEAPRDDSAGVDADQTALSSATGPADPSMITPHGLHGLTGARSSMTKAGFTRSSQRGECIRPQQLTGGQQGGSDGWSRALSDACSRN